jgi:hypothetical protein
LLNCIATVSGAAGKTIAKIPVIGNTQIDETLIESGERLERFGSQRTLKTMRRLSDSRSGCVMQFVSCIHIINTLYNRQTEVLFDHDNFYLAPSCVASAEK